MPKQNFFFFLSFFIKQKKKVDREALVKQGANSQKVKRFVQFIWEQFMLLNGYLKKRSLTLSEK